MFCPQCASQIPSNSSVCPVCNSRIILQAIPPTEEDTTQIINPAANTPYTSGDTSPFQASQGGTSPMPPLLPTNSYTYTNPSTHARYQEAPFTPINAPAATKKKSKLPVIIGVLAVILLLLFAARYLLNNAKSLSESTDTPAATVEKAANAATNLDFETLLDTIPPELLSYSVADRSELVNYLDSSIDELDEQMQLFGLKARDLAKIVTFTPGDVSYYSDDGLEALRAEWNSRIPGFGDSFEDAATVSVDISGEFNILGQRISLSDYIGSAQQNVTTVQIDGKWYLLDSDILDLAELDELSDLVNLL